MKAVILLAGLGNRLQPLTLTTPKSLLPIGNSNTLEHMIRKLIKHDVSSFVIVCGHMQKEIQNYLEHTFPLLNLTIVTNDYYRTTNTGYSLMLAKEYLQDETFIKLDGDVIFQEEIIKKLVAAEDGLSYVCVDSTAVDEEVIKVQCGADGNVTRIGNKLPVAGAVGESIGIERIGKRSSAALFEMLEKMMENSDNYQNYYEVAYDAIIQAGEPFKALDITGLHWVEIDTLDDYKLAQHYFSHADA
ncbi:MAG: phosphocholine cytidylyltransferase family protein [Candidatus Aquicultor sp.]|nr:phosphocholine cytidylyltransferase family protein [Candidatus Aquicultor sp.]